MTIPNYFEEWQSCLNCDRRRDDHPCERARVCSQNEYWLPRKADR